MEEQTQNTDSRTKEVGRLIRITHLVEFPFQSRFNAFTAGKGLAARQQDIEELAESIRENGLMQPINVRPLGNRYEIIDGHRRVQAMRLLGRGQIMAIVREVEDREAQIMHVIGNLQRRNLKPVEQALTYQKMLDAGLFKDKRELSRAIGKDETFVGDLLGTLKLDSRIIEDLVRNNLVKDLKVLRLIRKYSALGDDGRSDEQWELYRKVLFTRMSRRELTLLVNRKKTATQTTGWTLREGARKIIITVDAAKLPARRKVSLVRELNAAMESLLGAL